MAASLPPKLVEEALQDFKNEGLGNDIYKASAIKDLTKTLKKKKADVENLSVRDLLRRDFKEYIYVLAWAGNQSIVGGLSTVPVGLETMGKDGKLGEAIISWMRERKLAVFGVLTSFHDDKDKKRRELAFVVYDAAAPGPQSEAVDFKKLAKRLWDGLEDNKEVKVKKHKKVQLKKLPTEARWKAYKQNKAEASRKVIAPLIKDIIERADNPADKKKKSK